MPAMALFCGMGAPAALADVTATFTETASSSTTLNGRARLHTVIEVASDGSARIEMGNGAPIDDGYTLIRDGKIYRVSPGPGGPVAVSAEADAYNYRQSVRRGEIIPSSHNQQQRRPSSLVAKGEVRIAGYTGTQYALSDGGRPVMVVTDDPQLKPLGTALDRFLGQTTGQEADPDLAQIRSLVAAHGPLSLFGGQDLSQVSFAPIDPRRFALPARVVELADVKEPDDEASRPSGRSPETVAGAYHAGLLYLLDESGTVQVWPEGSDHGTPYETPGPVSSFCFAREGIWALTREGPSKPAVLWSRRIASGMAGAEAWSKVGAFPQNAKRQVLTLDCSGLEPIVVSTDGLIMPISGRSVPLKGDAPLGPGYVVSQVRDGMLWLGLNAGEWGGGLRRIRLADGVMDAPSNVDSKSLCGGTLNPACDPVTGLAPDPVRADCMIATIGLVHMMSHGSVVRICGKDVSLVYAKPYTLKPDWHWDGKLDGEREASVAFQSMAAAPGGGKAFAVASDGLYLFTGAPQPDFKPFPVRRGGVVDWSHLEFVLVETHMNQRHSVSGGSFILIPR